MSKKKLAGIIVGVVCIIVIIVVIVINTRPPTATTPAQNYTLTTHISPPGAGSVSPSGGEYESGVQVTLTASPASDYTFDYWSDSASGTTFTININITMDSDKSLTAHFETIPTGPEVLFSDDFSDESSGWFTYDTSYGRAICRDGCLYVKDYTAQDAFMYGESQHYFTDFILGVETWLVDGTGDNWHLVLCRSKVESNYYAFGISADGYYTIVKCVDGKTTILVEATYSAYIHQGQGVTNLIHIECVGSNLSLSVNGHLLEEVTDATFTGGGIALAANAVSGTFTEVAFDNIIVTEPGPEEPEPVTPTQFTTYTDEIGLFSISYPSEWELSLELIDEELEEAGILFVAGLPVPATTGLNPNVTVGAEPLPEGTWTHDEVVTASIEGTKAVVSDYHESSRIKTTIDNRTATIIDWQGTYAEIGTLRSLQMLCPVNKTLWGVTITASLDEYSEWEDDFDAVVRSLRILK